MARKRSQNKPRRIAIAIELDQPYPHHYDCCRGIQRYADERGWQTVIDPYLVGMTGRAGAAEYDGVVGRITRQTAEAARARGIPVVNHWLNSLAKDLPSVFADYREGGRIAGEHLLARGFRHFGYLGVTRDRGGSLELAGFAQAVKAPGFKAPATLSGPRDFEASHEAFGRFRKHTHHWLAGLIPPVGILVGNETMARYLVQICRELNLRVPLDVGIVEQRDNYVVSMGIEPSLSSVDHDWQQIGYRAAQLLNGLMSSRRRPPTKPILIPPKGLTVRESSDAFVVADPLAAKALRYIADHAREAVTVEDVARHVHTTTRTLERRFKEFLHRPASHEINRLRTEYIKRRLEEPAIRLGDLARECGFHSPSHFALFFRKMTGIRPKDYRKGIAKK
jgi:LacI family transcriptional regulator